MKKKTIIGLIILIIILIVSITACSKIFKNKGKNTLEFIEEKEGYTTTFKYNNKKYVKDPKENYTSTIKSLTFTDEVDGLEITMNYSRYSTKTFEPTKKVRKELRYFGEYKYGKYNAYSYGINDKTLYLLILLDSNKKDEEVILNMTITKVNNKSDEDVLKLFEKEGLQNIFNTIKYKVDKKIVKK